MKSTLFIFLTIILLSCNQKEGNYDNSNNGNLSVNKQAIIDSIDFCTKCDSLNIWQGAIQGTNKSDSTGIYLFAECTTNRYFDLIWVPKGNILKFKSSISIDSLSKYYDYSEKENYKNLDCYSFVIPEKKRNIDENSDDLDTYEYDFPSQVSVFKKVDKGWMLITKKNIKSIEELGRLKLNTIFHR